ncbi:MAG: GAF domain-containing protein [Candidatus Riflebacteria bacterium]|nr:GAF domain-containing protein [Candidatus Riflebacteria bacterium]
MTQTEIAETIAPLISRRPALKLRLFAMQALVLSIVIFFMAGSELARWRELSETHVSTRGMTLVHAVEPHVLKYIHEKDLAGLESMVKSLTSPEIPNNDLVTVQVLDTEMHKLAESSPYLGEHLKGFLYLPATVVVANPVTDPQTGHHTGILRMVFSNRYFEERSQEVVSTTILALIAGIFLALMITWLLGRMIQTPVRILADAATKMAGGNADIQLELDANNEIGVLIEAFNQMSQRINVHLTELRQKNTILETRNFELSTLQQIGRSLSSILDQEMVYETIVDNVINVLSGVKRCSLLLVDEKRNEFIFRVVKGLDPEVIPEGGRMPIDTGIAAKVFHTGEAVLLNDIEDNEDTRLLEASKVVRSSICAPILVANRVVGVLSLSNKISGVAFTETDLRLVEGVAVEASIAIKNARMWQDLKRKVLELNTLHEVGKNLSLVLDINKLLELVLDLTARVLGGVKTSSVILYDAETESLAVMLYKGNRSVGSLQPIKSGEGIAGKVFERGEPIIINDFSSTDQGSGVTGRSSICVPLKVKEKTIGVLSVSDKISGDPFDNSDLDMLVTLASQISVSLYNAQLYEDLEASYLSAVRALANSIDAKDAYTRGHSERVARYSMEIGRAMGLTTDEIKNLHIGALLYDIGKIGIAEAIINKNSKLTDEEYQEIKTHPSRGAAIIEPAKFLKEKVPLIRFHHERYDGRGYPDGLKGEEIPLMARIVCCADSFDAMTSKRAYRDTMPLEEARKELIKCSGTQFDPRVVNAFLEVLSDEKKFITIENLGK